MTSLRPTSFRAVLDANVLVMAGPRDTLLRAAEEGLYRALWSEAILDEVRRNVIRLLEERGLSGPADRVDYLLYRLRRAYPEALVEGYEGLVPVMTNQEKDRHVLAAAVSGGAQVIVTENLRDFPSIALSPYGIEAHSPDEFLLHLLDLDPEGMVRILREQGAEMQTPRTINEILDRLAPQLPQFIASVRQLIGGLG